MRSLCGEHPAASIPISRIGSQTLYLNQILSLQRGGWVHSAVIQAWIDLLAMHRHTVTSEDVGKHHKTWLRDSFFYDRLTGVVRDGSTGKVTDTKWLDLDAVSRDTKRFDTTGLAKIIIPINICNSHWILASINVKSKTITLFDSMRGSNLEVYMALHE